jgi:Tfp pilus assembly protein PilN
MKPLRIDFAQCSFKRLILQTPIASWLLLAIALACWIGFSITAAKLVQKKDAAAAELGAVLRRTQAQLDERNARKAAAGKVTISEAQAGAVNAAIAQLNLPWRDLFDALEAATPPGIALLSIEPDAKKHLLKGSAETKSDGEMIAYIEQLKKQAFFSNVMLTKHELNDQDPNKPFRFQFEAEWSEAAR